MDYKFTQNVWPIIDKRNAARPEQNRFLIELI